MPIPAIILISLGCALILAGFIYFGVMVARLIMAARKAGINSMTDVQLIMRKVEDLEPRFRQLERNQAALSETMQRLSKEAAKFNFLRGELDKATGRITDCKK